MEPGDLYCWGTVILNNNKEANVLVASDNLLNEEKTIKGSFLMKKEVVDNPHCDNNAWWEGCSDALFTKGMSFLQEKYFDNPNYNRAPRKYLLSEEDFYKLFRLQMAYAFLWTIIDRHNTIKYGFFPNDLKRQRTAMANDPLFMKAVNLIGENFIFNYPGICASNSGRVKFFTGANTSSIDTWRELIEMYYQVRCNVVHRGKSGHDSTDYPKLRGAFLDIFAIMQYMLRTEFKTAKNPLDGINKLKWFRQNLNV